MSIGPVQSIVSSGEAQSADVQPRVPQQPPTSSREQVQVAQPVRPDPQPAAKREAQAAKAAEAYPQDQVQVARDTELRNELIFKYVDHAGNVIFQVPSNEALSVKRGIQQEFEQRANRSAERER